MSGGINPVLALVSRSDALAEGFRQSHASTLPSVSQIAHLQQMLAVGASSSSGQAIEPQLESLLTVVRDALSNMERCVEEMFGLLYQVDIFLSQPTTQLAAGFNPKQALEHVSASVHAYQSELLSKRELLSDFTCEDIGAEDFLSQWSVLKEVNAGASQDADALADLLAGFG